MNDTMPAVEPYGRYAPDANTGVLRMITRLGLAHGGIAKHLHRCWLEKHGPVVDVEVRGLKYRLNLRDNTTDVKILISSKNYDARELGFLAKASAGKVFVDIGANIGYYTLNMVRAGCVRAIAIEPNPPALERLAYNLSINGMDDRVDVVAAGVGPGGELEFYQTGGLGGSGFVKPEQSAPVIKVRTIPLLDILEQRKVDRIGGLKIDVEGFEDQVLTPFLDGAPDSLLPSCVVMESCHNDDWGSDLKAKFLSKGYRLVAQTRANFIFVRN
jgi:FkbM family methyltransferase